MSGVITDVENAPHAPVPAATVVYPTSSQAGLASVRRWWNR